MYSTQTALNQYKKIDTESALTGATPHRLIELLMSGALDRMTQAKAALAGEDIASKGLLLGKAISIIAGLQASLDKEKGGEIADNLDNLYDYMQRRLLQANVSNDMGMVDEVADLMTKIQSSWVQIGADAESQ